MLPPSKSGTVLVIEQDEIILHAFAVLLTAAGLVVRKAMIGRDGLSDLDRGGIEVVVANVRLPDLSGAELLRAIRERDADLPVIFVTGWPDLERPTVIATGSSSGASTSAEGLRGTVVTAAVSYRLQQHARRRARSPSSPLEGDP